MNFASNIHMYREPEKDSKSIQDHVKDTLVKLMISEDTHEVKKTKKHKSVVVTSESGSESSRSGRNDYDERAKLFGDVVDDYLGYKKGSIFKSFNKKFGGKEDVSMEEYARFFLSLEQEYTKLAKDTDKPKKKRALYEARAIFAKVAHMTLRNANSTSILERAFGECMISVAGRRVALRNIFIFIFEIIFFSKSL